MKSHPSTQSVVSAKDTMSSEENHSHGSKHMLMMAVCCGLPILALLAVGALGIVVPGLELLILLVCPIGMGYMMYSMRKEGKSSCCASEQADSPSISQQDASKKAKSCCH